MNNKTSKSKRQMHARKRGAPTARKTYKCVYCGRKISHQQYTGGGQCADCRPM